MFYPEKEQFHPPKYDTDFTGPCNSRSRYFASLISATLLQVPTIVSSDLFYLFTTSFPTTPHYPRAQSSLSLTEMEFPSGVAAKIDSLNPFIVLARSDKPAIRLRRRWNRRVETPRDGAIEGKGSTGQSYSKGSRLQAIVLWHPLSQLHSLTPTFPPHRPPKPLILSHSRTYKIYRTLVLLCVFNSQLCNQFAVAAENLPLIAPPSAEPLGMGKDGGLRQRLTHVRPFAYTAESRFSSFTLNAPSFLYDALLYFCTVCSHRGIACCFTWTRRKKILQSGI